MLAQVAATGILVAAACKRQALVPSPMASMRWTTFAIKFERADRVLLGIACCLKEVPLRELVSVGQASQRCTIFSRPYRRDQTATFHPADMTAG